MSKRKGTFCDHNFRPSDELCPQLAVGECIGCGKDTCATHGNAEGISVSIQRIPEGSTSHVELCRAGVTICNRCLALVTQRTEVIRKHALPVITNQLGEAIRAALAIDALKKD